MNTVVAWFSVGFNVIRIRDISALRCYACYGIGPNNECDNYTNFVKAWKSDNQQYGSIRLKRCSAPYNITCIINTYVNKNGRFFSLFVRYFGKMPVIVMISVNHPNQEIRQNCHNYIISKYMYKTLMHMYVYFSRMTFFL